MKTLAKIFFVTLRIGAFTFGGGYAMIPLMQAEFVDKYHWIDEKDIVDVFAVAQSLPGVIAVNSCILIGNKIAGIAGGFAAALGCILPSLFILSAITRVYSSFIANAYVLGALDGISAAVVALMLSAVVKLSKQSLKEAISLAIAACALGISLFFPSVNAVFIIIGAAILGLGIKFLGTIGKNKKDKRNKNK
ncbi:MAG: chromate transporter [Oscillospiraceae bacterium]|nr:chromate transporter [Oscillospiraceae bacterium]